MKLNDLLRLRRTCMQLHDFVDAFIRKQVAFVEEMEINDSPDKNLEAFITLGIVPKKLFINNPGGQVFYEEMDDQALTYFQENMAHRIKSLKVLEISLFPSSKEWKFLSSFKDLEEFSAQYYGHGGAECLNIGRAREEGLDLTGPMLPAEWTDCLKKLKIGHNQKYPINYDIRPRHAALLESYSNLEQVAIPYLSFDLHSNSGFKRNRGQLMSQESFNLQFLVYGFLAARGKLKIIDFKSLHEETNRGIVLLNRLATQSIFLMFRTCLMSGTKLKNVNADWFTFHDPAHDLYDSEHGSVVLSMVNLNSSVCDMDFTMPNLEELDIRETARSSVNPLFDFIRPEWPSLRKIKIHINSAVNVEENQDTGMIYNFLWDDEPRERAEDLTISFERDMPLPIPSTRDIVVSMPNLNKLTIRNWIGSNDDLLTLWTGLRHLKHVTVDSCTNVANEAFIGTENSSFIHLQGKQYFYEFWIPNRQLMYCIPFCINRT